MYGILISSKALHELKKVPVSTARLIREKLEFIAIDPFASHPNVQKLQGREGYRLRVGDWRVIYTIEKQDVVILVIKVGHRSEVYK